MPATFTPELFRFLTELAAHNDRDWFTANRARYETHVKAASLSFIDALAPRMAAISPHIRVDARALFRIHRDTRFSHDKSPYKTHVGLHFRHDSAKDVHSPGFYLGIGPDDCQVGLGLWRPDGPTLKAIRTRIARDPATWLAMDAGFRKAGLSWSGEALQRVPKPWAADQAAAEHLKHKDHVLMVALDDAEIVSAGLLDRVVGVYEAGAPLVRDLCRTLDLAF